MIPVVAIVGRPNVGKSTLFNRITRTRDALVADFPGLTRDRQYGDAIFQNHHFILIDTGGIAESETDIDQVMTQQTQYAIDEADVILFVVDAREGMTASENIIADYLRKINKPVLLVINKIDGIDTNIATGDFYQLSFDAMLPVAASQGRGMQVLQQTLISYFPEQDDEDDDNVEGDRDPGIRLAIVGRPNVGKSTLVNRILGEDRVIVFDMPGTTRDSIKIPMVKDGKPYTLIDTAGLRRRGRIKEAVEKFSIVKTLQAIESADVVICLFDAQEGITEQDLHVLGFVLDAGKSLVIGINKWDGLTPEHRERIKVELTRRLEFVPFAKIHLISAKHGTGVGDLFGSVQRAFQSATKAIGTTDINNALADIVSTHQPPMVHGRRIKLRYAHLGGRLPPIFVIHGNQLDDLPDSYKRYLMNSFRKIFKLEGTPIRLEFVSGDNPYKDIKNERTARQIRKRQRLMRHYKKK